MKKLSKYYLLHWWQAAGLLISDAEARVELRRAVRGGGGRPRELKHLTDSNELLQLALLQNGIRSCTTLPIELTIMLIGYRVTFKSAVPKLKLSQYNSELLQERHAWQVSRDIEIMYTLAHIGAAIMEAP